MQPNMLWSLHQLQRALSLEVIGVDVPVSGISIDTRTLQKGDMFIALQAERDGHDFVADATEKGASCCLVSKQVEVNIPQLLVEDTLDALTTLAENRVANHSGKRIAVTGSSGKTSFTHMLATVCHAYKPEKSYNNHWGVPLTLARMPEDSEIAVIEIGTNHPGEIAPLSELAKPHVAVVTNIAHAHIGNFENEEALVDEKLSIQQGLNDDGILILLESLNIKFADKVKADVLTFGWTHDADFYLLEKIHHKENQLKIATPSGDAVLKLSIHGDHHVLNALATVATIYALKLPMDLLENIHQVDHLVGRGAIRKIEGNVLIDDSFNANPLSMKMALRTLQNYTVNGRKIAILGDMLELGSQSEEHHINLLKYMDGIDGVVTVGENMNFLDERLPESINLGHYESVKDIDIAKFVGIFEKEDVILLKGSKGIFWIHNFADKLSEELKKKKHVL
jgi:UDP-N-acetylmuramoyl-tripeptide--D-alanyl-D-alanine ligase